MHGAGHQRAAKPIELAKFYVFSEIVDQKDQKAVERISDTAKWRGRNLAIYLGKSHLLQNSHSLR
jgi:hypothetical protein